LVDVLLLSVGPPEAPALPVAELPVVPPALLPVPPLVPVLPVEAGGVVVTVVEDEVDPVGLDGVVEVVDEGEVLGVVVVVLLEDVPLFADLSPLLQAARAKAQAVTSIRRFMKVSFAGGTSVRPACRALVRRIRHLCGRVASWRQPTHHVDGPKPCPMALFSQRFAGQARRVDADQRHSDQQAVVSRRHAGICARRGCHTSEPDTRNTYHRP
jgi:hypothetical protein